MGTAYTEEVTTTVASATGYLKELILKSSDWAHLQLSTGTANTTLTADAAPGATSISTTATIPSGTIITLWASTSMNGAPTPECRTTTGVSGTGPYTVTFTRPLVGSYSTTHAVGVGTYVKATTTRGAQMVVDLQDAAITAQRIQAAVYRTHDGTTGVDKVTRYLYWKSAVGATTDNLHLVVSAGKEHLYFSVEGPRVGETNTDSSVGSMRQFLALSDIAPYFNSSFDLVPAVCLIANKDNTYAESVWQGQPNTRDVYVSRNGIDDASWVRATLMTLGNPANDTSMSINSYYPIGLDGSFLMLPWVVFEDAKGIRGSLTRFFYGGARSEKAGDPTGMVTNIDVTYGGVTYRSLIPFKGSGSGNQFIVSYAFGHWYNRDGATPGPIIFVPKA